MNLIETQTAPFQDGTTFVNSQLDDRDITINGRIMAAGATDLANKKRELQRIFNPKYEGTLTYTNGTFESSDKQMVIFWPPGGGN